jgi:prepilin-type N-terminal cleavage/methylation domain-containing protein
MRLLLKIKTLLTPWAGQPAANAASFSGIIKRPKGFTLIEVIVTIIAASFLGAIFINYMGTAMSQSTRAIELVRAEAEAEAKLERIVADYVYETNRYPNDALNTIVTRNQSQAYGNKITMRYITFVISGTTGTENILSSGTSDTLKVTVELDVPFPVAGKSLTTLLTKSRLAGSPTVQF